MTKREVEQLVAALDDIDGEDLEQRIARLRDAVAAALARLVGGHAPWPELIDRAAAFAQWPPTRVQRLKGSARSADTADALEALITELNETRGL